jgi:hypothetical protein
VEGGKGGQIRMLPTPAPKTSGGEGPKGRSVKDKKTMVFNFYLNFILSLNDTLSSL